MGKRTRNFTRQGISYAIEADYFNSSETVLDDRGRYTEEEVDFTLEYVEQVWRLYMDLGFQSFGISNGGVIKYEVFFDARRNGNGFANNARTTLDTKRRRDGNESSYKFLIVHELFHAVQFADDHPFMGQKAFVEGTANVAGFLCDLDVRNDIGISQYTDYLDNPGATMWDRPSPGRPKDNRGITTLWWLYFCDQIGEGGNEVGTKMDALLDLINMEYEPINPWMTENNDLATPGDFLGNGDTQLLYHWRNLEYGLVSFNESFGGNGARHRIVRQGERWGDSWRGRPEDRIFGKGDILGNGRDQIVMVSRNPTHIGILGFTESDGSPDRAQSLETYAVVGENRRWGRNGWKVRKRDEVVAIGNLMSNTQKQMVVLSRAPMYFGVLGMEADGGLKTYAVLLEGSSFGRDGWVLTDSDRVVAVGNFVGNGMEQIVIQGGDPWSVGIVGFEPDGSPKTYAKVQVNERFGGGWKVRPNDAVVGVGHFISENRCHILVKNSGPDYLGVVGLSDSGETETIMVVSEGGALGSDWSWKPTDRILGVGNFVGNGKQQFGIWSGSPKRMAVIGFDERKQVTTYDYCENERSSPLDNVYAIGDFSGLGRDQFYGERGRYLVCFSFEDPKLDDIGNWRDRFAIAKDTYFYSTLSFLNQYTVRKANKRLINLWRDFSITNVTKELAGAPSQYSYSFENLPEARVAVTAALVHGSVDQNFRINRWAAAYFDLDTEPGQTSLHLKGKVVAKTFPVFWSVVIEDRNGAFKNVILHEGNSMDRTINFDTLDKLTLIVTTTYANVTVSISNLG
ncbi:MAG: hypothetical protein AAFP76_07395 [Bacteroidota bacterium]